jgi:PIN domain nuclease of toxin-antitoxin system
MDAVVADTHALVWYLIDPDALSAPAAAALDGVASRGGQIVVPAIVLVELVYLVEKGRLPAIVLERLVEAMGHEHSGVTVAPLDGAVALAVGRVARDAVPNMPDRIIAATALHLGLPLVSRDRRIRAANVPTIW